MKTDLERKEDLIRIDKEEYDMSLFQLIRTLYGEIYELESMLVQIDYYKRHGYRIEYYKTSDEGSMSFRPIKKEIGFNPRANVA